MLVETDDAQTLNERNKPMPYAHPAAATAATTAVTAAATAEATCIAYIPNTLNETSYVPLHLIMVNKAWNTKSTEQTNAY